MMNRSDSVDALMYAYYEFMKMKEANKMLEKDKDYIEFSMRSFMATHKPGQCTDINITGISPEPGVLCTKNPFDIPCDVVVIPKRAFDRLQTDNQHYRELAKQREENYNLLLKKTGFDTVESLVFYLTNVGQSNTLLEALASLRDRAKYTCDEWKDLNRKLQECEKDYISERDKAEALEKENEELKKKLHEPDPFAECKELSKNLYSVKDAEELEWVLNHVCGGHASVNGWMVTAKLWRRNYETLSKLVGFVTVEETQDYLTNEAECDTLHEAISKLKDQVKYTCDEWYSANSRNNSWKAAAECNTPKELMEKIEALETENIDLKTKNTEYACKIQDLIDDSCGRKTVIESYKRDIEKWQEATGCETPDKAREHLSKLRDEGTHIVYLNDPLGIIAKWVKVTGYDKPEDFLKWKANIGGIMEAWKSGTGCKYPSEARILLEKWKVLTKCETPEAAATWITSYEKACERGNRFAEEVEEWKKATGCETPGAAEKQLAYYRGRLGNAVQAASCAMKHLDSITF